MKKTIIGITLLGIAVIAFGAYGIVNAQSETPPNPEYPYRHGWGMMGRGFGWMGAFEGEGPMHDAMVATLAEALNLDPEDIKERHDTGESIWQIAADEGLSDEEIRTLMQSSHDAALAEAVASGWLTEEQAEWMGDHMGWMWSAEGDYSGYGGHCGGRRDNFNNTGWGGMRY